MSEEKKTVEVESGAGKGPSAESGMEGWIEEKMRDVIRDEVATYIDGPPKEKIREAIMREGQVLMEEIQGKVVERLAPFFYLLMRDHVPVGVVNELLRDALNGKEHKYSDGILEAKASSVAIMMVMGKYIVKELECNLVHPLMQDEGDHE